MCETRGRIEHRDSFTVSVSFPFTVYRLNPLHVYVTGLPLPLLNQFSSALSAYRGLAAKQGEGLAVVILRSVLDILVEIVE